jgi:hypothetical protein
LDYISVPEHFQQAGLSVFNNNWSSIHDFTPIEGESNWCLFPDTIRIQDYISLPASQELQRQVSKNLQTNIQLQVKKIPCLHFFVFVFDSCSGLECGTLSTCQL